MQLLSMLTQPIVDQLPKANINSVTVHQISVDALKNRDAAFKCQCSIEASVLVQFQEAGNLSRRTLRNDSLIVLRSKIHYSFVIEA